MNPATEPKIDFSTPVAPGSRLVDTHAHLHFSQFAGEVDGAMRRAAEAGVTRVVNVGTSTEDSRRAVELAAVYENVWATVGIHPHEAGEAEQGRGYLRDLAAKRKVVAIGECGLDFYRQHHPPEQQEKAFRLQIQLAIELGMPMVFHVRDAYDEFFAVMRDYPEVKQAVVHSFSGGMSELEAVIEHGWHLALNGIVTFTKEEAKMEVFRRVPLENLLLETDCPFLSPAPYRGKLNEPARVAEIAKFLSGLRGESYDVLASATTSNAQKLFNLI